MKIMPLQQHGWTQRWSYWVKEDKIAYDIACMWNIKITWYKRTYLQNRNRLTDVKKQTYGYQGRSGGRDKFGNWNWHIHTTIHKIWRRHWRPTPVLLPGKSHGRRSLVGCSPWVTKSRTQLSDFTFTFHFHALEKEMASHSSVLSRRIPRTAEPGGLPSMGSESDTTEAT